MVFGSVVPVNLINLDFKKNLFRAVFDEKALILKYLAIFFDKKIFKK